VQSLASPETAIARGGLASAELLRTLGLSIAWTVLLYVAVVIFALALGLFFARLTGIDRRTSLMGSCPGGIAELVFTLIPPGTRSDGR
jgi:uncharacterized membrane protein AbrB (regulator of aidB expression)